jgi:hypothetical protein
VTERSCHGEFPFRSHVTWRRIFANLRPGLPRVPCVGVCVCAIVPLQLTSADKSSLSDEASRPFFAPP